MTLLQRSAAHHTTFLSVNIDNQPDQLYKKCITKISKVPRYQIAIGVFITIFYSLILFNTMIGPFVFMNPLIECNGQPLAQQQACLDFTECKITNNFTAAYKNNLYCQKQTIRSTIQSVFGFGYLTGKVGFPLLSDVIGRRRCLLIALSLGVMGMCMLLIGIQYGWEVLMMVGQVAAGIFGSGISTLGSIYVCDWTYGRIREICLTNCWTIWGLMEMLYYILYFYMPGWKFYLSTTLLIPISIVLIIFLYMQLESPVYALFVRKSPEAFDEIVDQVAKYNKLTFQQRQQIKQDGRKIVSLLKKGTKNELHLKHILRKTFCEIKNIKIISCLILTSVGYVFFYFGMQGSMQSVGFNFGVNMFFVGITQFFAFLTSSFITNRVKTKPGIFFSSIISAVIGILFLFDFVKQSQILQTILIVLARLAASYVFCFFALFSAQILPIQIRNTSFSIIDCFGEISRIILPYVINIMYNINLHPIIAFSVVLIVLCGLPVLILRENAKEIGKGKKQDVKYGSEASNLYEGQNSGNFVQQNK